MTENDEGPRLSDEEAIQALERFVVENDDLLELESEIGKFNIFDALRIVRAEIRHSNFLSFILDPAESHGHGQLLLKAVLMDLLRLSPVEARPLSPIHLDGVDLRGVEVRREWEHIDLLIICESPPFVVAIENKVGAKEYSDQLARYQKAVLSGFPGKRCLFVYLTPDADEPTNEDWVPYSYSDLHRVLRRVYQAYSTLLGEDVRVFLGHYLNLIGTRFMNDPTIDELCKRIYKNHRRALDLIYDRVAAPGSGILAEAASAIEDDKRWHIFTQGSRRLALVPQSWLDWLPAWGLKEDPKSWLFLRLYLHDYWLEFTMHVQEMKVDPQKRKEIVELLLQKLPDKGFTKSKSKAKGKGTRVTGSEKVFGWNEDETPDPGEIRKAVKATLDRAFPKCDGVQELLRDKLK